MARNTYLALGDSITVGYSATHPSIAFVSKVSQTLREQSIASDTLLVAQNGWTARHLLTNIQVLPQSVWERTSAITLMIGGNDLRRRYYAVFSNAAPPLQVLQRSVDEFQYHLRQVCEILASAAVPHVFIQTIYNPLPHAPLVDHAIQRLNTTIQKCAELHGFDVIDVYKAFDGRQSELIHRYRTGRIEDLAFPFARPIHPNNQGHGVIADLILHRLEQRIARVSAHRK